MKVEVDEEKKMLVPKSYHSVDAIEAEENKESNVNTLVLIEKREFAEYIHQFVFQDPAFPLPPSNPRVDNAVFLLKGLLISFGLTAGLSYADVSFKVGEHHSPLGYFTAGGTSISYGLTVTWILIELINTSFLPDKKIRNFMEKKNSLTIKVENITCNMFGLLSSIPTAYVINTYSGSKFLAVQAFLVDYFLKTLGYFEIMEFLKNLYLQIRSRNADYFTRNAIYFKKIEFADAVEQLIKPAIIDNPALISGLFDFPVGLSPDEKIRNFFSKVEEQAFIVRNNHSPQSTGVKCLRIGFKILTLFPAGGDFTINFYLTFQAAQDVTNSLELQLILATLAALPLLSLDMLSYLNTVDNVFQGVDDYYTGNESPSFIEKFQSTYFSISISLLCFIFSALSAYGDGYVTEDQLEQSNINILMVLSYWLACAVFSSSTVFEGFASKELFSIAYLKASSYFNNPIQKNVADSLHKLSIFSDCLRKSKDSLFLSYHLNAIEAPVIESEDNKITFQHNLLLNN